MGTFSATANNGSTIGYAQYQLDAAARESILLNANTRLQSASVQDGRVYWVEDISKINRIQAQLAEINAQLSEENELIQAENALKRQRAQI